MAKIFRQLRFNLLGENKPGQYLKYAIGEIILVVVGILIALQINNWNEAKKEEKVLREYLVKIQSHTFEDLRKLDTIIHLRTTLATQCKLARKVILDKTEDQNLFQLMSCGGAFADYYFKPNTGGYDALKSSGYFGKINNTPLDSLLTRYHILLNEIAQNEQSYNEFMVGQSAYLSTQFDRSLILAAAFVPQDSLKLRATPQAEYNEVIRQYTASAPYRNVISLAAWQFDTMVEQYRKLQDIGKHVMEEIDVRTHE